MSKRTRLDTSHEVRMWIKDVIVPAGATAVSLAYLFPEQTKKVCNYVKEKVNSIKNKLKKED